MQILRKSALAVLLLTALIIMGDMIIEGGGFHPGEITRKDVRMFFWGVLWMLFFVGPILLPAIALIFIKRSSAIILLVVTGAIASVINVWTLISINYLHTVSIYSLILIIPLEWLVSFAGTTLGFAFSAAPCVHPKLQPGPVE